MSTTTTEIERLSERRQEVWAGAPEREDDEARKIGKRLEALYETRREEECAGRNGSRDTLQSIAKVESELDKLATPPRSTQ